MKIFIKKLKNGHYKFQDEQELEKLEIKDHVGKYNLEIELEKTDSQIVLKNIVKVEYTVACDRCLVEFVNRTKSEFELYFIFSNSKKNELDDNTKYIDEESEYIDITNDIRDYIILSFPMQHICKEECLGLCPRCGKDLNVEQCECKEESTNPIWDELKKIKFS